MPRTTLRCRQQPAPLAKISKALNHFQLRSSVCRIHDFDDAPIVGIYPFIVGILLHVVSERFTQSRILLTARRERQEAKKLESRS